MKRRTISYAGDQVRFAHAIAVLVIPTRFCQERLPCEWRHDCAIVVDSDEAFARAPARPVAFAAPEGAGYDPGRLFTGLAVAAAFLGFALWLLFFTDWSAIGEAAAPEIDDAEFADLDEIIAALGPAEDRESV